MRAAVETGIMKKVLLYLLGTIVVPLLVIIWWRTVIGEHETFDYWLHEAPVPIRIIAFLVMLMLAVIVGFGPTIYAIWRKKISWAPILALNAICLVFGFFPSLWLWIWAICGKTRPTLSWL
jgi:hypothetical protein